MGRQARLRAERNSRKKETFQGFKPDPTTCDDHMTMDRKYFELHPNKKVFYRSPTTNEKAEFTILEPEKTLTHVKVTQIAEGFRLREFEFE